MVSSFQRFQVKDFDDHTKRSDDVSARIMFTEESVTQMFSKLNKQNIKVSKFNPSTIESYQKTRYFLNVMVAEAFH